MNKIVVCENLRSSYNVWNIIRTADALGFDVVISGYTPFDEKVFKTSLGAEKKVKIIHIWNPLEAIKFSQKYWKIVAAEITPTSKDLRLLDEKIDWFVLGNEITWVLPQTLEMIDVYHIPMIWEKESLNVWQAAAIFMWHINLKNF